MRHGTQGVNMGLSLSRPTRRMTFHSPYLQERASCARSRGEPAPRLKSETHSPHRSPIHQNIKEKIVASTERDTVHIFRTLHNTARVFKNAVSQQVVALERRPGGAKFEDVRDLVSGQRGREVYTRGDPDYGIWTAGIVMGLIKDIPTCEELLRRIEREAEEVIGGMAALVVPAKAKL